MSVLRLIGITGLLLGLAAAPAAAQGRGDHDTPATQGGANGWQYRAQNCRASGDGWVMCRDANGYWQRDHYDPGWSSDYGYSGNFGYGGGYGNGGGYGVLPPQVIVHNLYRSGFSSISQPLLAGQFYQVKAIDPNGRKVKLYVDAYYGRIAKVKD